jgi:glycosyltransferase involved in cell wall biosynthesis
LKSNLYTRKLEIKHIYWFAPFNLKGPSTRYRGFYPLEVLKKDFGINSDFTFPEKSKSGVWNFIKIYSKALLFRRKDSIIVIQKICSNRIYSNLLKFLVILQSKNTLFDVDDAEYLRHNNGTLHFFLKNCKKITVGSSALKEYCETYNKQVYLLTSPIVEHPNQKVKRNLIPNIGWVGDFGNGNKISQEFSHKKSVYDILFPQIKKIDTPIILTLIGVKNENDIPEIFDYFKDHSNIEIKIPTNLNWEKDDWVYSEIEKFDIGVSPMTNHLFNVSKSAFKAKQYLSVGIPTIASDVGENDKFVKHNKNGFICKNGIEFSKALSQLLEMNDEEYFDLSRNAMRNKEEFSMNKYCSLLLEMYQI